MAFTGATAALDGFYRRRFLVNGTSTDSFTLAMGVSSGTANDWSARNMSVGYLSWNVPGTTGYLLVQWENIGAGATHETILALAGSNTIDFRGRDITFKNTAVNPSGNVIVQPFIPPGSYYSLVAEFVKPYNGIVH